MTALHFSEPIRTCGAARLPLNRVRCKAAAAGAPQWRKRSCLLARCRAYRCTKIPAG